MLLRSGDIFHLASISLRITQCIDSHSEASSLTWIVNRESHSVMAATPSVHIPIQMPDSGVLLCNHSKTWIVLWLWCWLATKLHITYPHAHPLKNRFLKNKIVALLSTFIDLSTWIAYHRNSLTSNNYASMSSAISSIHLVIVLAKRGTHATFWTAACPESSWQMSLVVGRINYSPTLLSSSMWLGTKNDAFSADTFDEVVAFNNCFCSSCSHFFFFWKTVKACPSMQRAWFLCGESVLKVSWLRCVPGPYILCRVGWRMWTT